MRMLSSSVSALALTALMAVPCWAQYGLYGAPDLLPLAAGAPTAAAADVPLAATPVAYSRPVTSARMASQPMSAPVEPAPAPNGSEPAAPKPADTSASEQMLDTSSASGSCGCYGEACQQFEQAACDCGVCGDCCGNCCGPWYFELTALGMSRDWGNGVWTTYQSGNLPNQMLKTTDVKLPWQFGGEIRFGRRFCCDQWALEGVYWGLDSQINSLTATAVPAVSTPLRVSDVQFGTDSAGDWFDGAAAHRVSRYNEFHNVEVNLVRNGWIGGCDCPWGVNWLIGARYFRFEENLDFASLRGGYDWGYPGAEAYLNDNIENNLIGFQLGADVTYQVCHNVRLFCEPRFGIFDNHIQNEFAMYLNDGTVANTGSTGVVGTYPVNSSCDRIAFLAEIDLGLDWQFSRCWSARVGYRVLTATGIGLADNQIPFYAVDVPEIASIDTNGDLILHGAFAGITYNF